MEAVPGILRQTSIRPRSRGLSDPEKSAWAHKELLTLIDREIADLKEADQSFDLTNLRQDRDETGDRVLFDASKEAVPRPEVRGRHRARLLPSPARIQPARQHPRSRSRTRSRPRSTSGRPPSPSPRPRFDSRPRGKLASYFQTALAPVELEDTRPIFAEDTEIHPTPGRHSAGPGRLFRPISSSFRSRRTVL